MLGKELNFKMNKNVEAIEISGIRKFFNKVSKYPDAISLTLGQPDFDVPSRVKDAIIKAVNDGKSKYTANAGIVELREEISKFLKTLDINYDKDEIMITVGGSEALFSVLMGLLNKGDKVLVPSIGYPAYESITKMLEGDTIDYKLNDDFTINIDSLEEGIKRGGKVLILSYPSNPTGALLSKEDRDKLHKVIKENDILVVTDEIYSSLCFEDNYFSVAQYDDIKNKIIYVSGFSKMFSMTGLRLGYVACNKKFLNEFIKVHQYGVSCAPSIVQWGALEGLRYCLNDVENMKNSFKERMEYVYDELIKMGFDVVKPKGAFYILPSIKKFNMTSEEFCDRLLSEGGVACVPGSAFGSGGEGYIRISYCYSKKSLDKALKAIKEFINTL